MRKNDKNKFHMTKITLMIIIIILGIILGQINKAGVSKCISSGNSREFCESGLLR